MPPPIIFIARWSKIKMHIKINPEGERNPPKMSWNRRLWKTGEQGVDLLVREGFVSVMGPDGRPSGFHQPGVTTEV